MPGNSLQGELHIFEQHRSEWLRSHCGEFVVVVGTNVIGFYPDFESAFRAGLPIASTRKDFLLKQVLAEEPVYHIY